MMSDSGFRDEIDTATLARLFPSFLAPFDSLFWFADLNGNVKN